MSKPINRETDERWAILGAYIRDIADRMGLGRWHFDLSHDVPECGDERFTTAARVEYAFGCLKFIITFGDIFFADYSPDEQRHTVVHELVHIVLSGSAANLDAFGTLDCISKTMWRLFLRGHTHITERETDWVASLIAPRFDYIDWKETNHE